MCPLTGIKEPLSNEDVITLDLINKAKKGDVNAYKALMDSAYGAVKQSVEVTEAETPIFKQLDIDVIDWINEDQVVLMLWNPHFSLLLLVGV